MSWFGGTARWHPVADEDSGTRCHLPTPGVPPHPGSPDRATADRPAPPETDERVRSPAKFPSVRGPSSGWTNMLAQPYCRVIPVPEPGSCGEALVVVSGMPTVMNGPGPGSRRRSA